MEWHPSFALYTMGHALHATTCTGTRHVHPSSGKQPEGRKGALDMRAWNREHATAHEKTHNCSVDHTVL
eukprot:9922136-Alexandrium_andersonii.AAC.1